MSQHFPKPYNCFRFVQLYNKSNLKGAIKVDTSNPASKSNLVKLKAEVNKINKD